ncbi:hypothetical protein pEaSNUABM54_00194 [Erwinia phage pEa_SNUABM_54]|nr:hypothetical protein pEaSNUABM54_00194 [Erwinia phage pEa_SNUABM_54]
MSALDKLKVWVDANPAAPDWFQREFPDDIKDELSAEYLKDPEGFKTAIKDHYQWTYKEAKDNDDDKYGFILIICTHHGEVTAYADKEVFKSMGESVSLFTKLNATWYGRLWLKITFTIYNWRNGNK